MNPQFSLTDDAIRQALTPASVVQAPSGLAESIRATVDGMPQRRHWVVGSLPLPFRPSLRALVLVALVSLLLLIGLLVAVGSRRPVLPASISDSTMFHGGPSRTGVVTGPGPTGQPTIAWEQSVGGAITANMPAVVGGLVYVADSGGGIEAFGAALGDRRWGVSLGSAANTSPAVDRGLVVVGDAAGDVVALDILDGSHRWTFHTAGEVRSSAAIVDGVVYVGSADGNLYGLDLATGAKRWTFAAGGAISRSPAVDGGVVYVGAAGGMFSAVDAATGSRRWQQSLGPGQVASPAVADGLVVTASGLDDPAAAHVLFALDAASGNERWTYTAPTGQTLYVGALGDASVFAVSDDHHVYALRAGDGTTLWRFDGNGALGSADALAGGVLYAPGGDRAVYAVDERTGAELWRLAVTGGPGGIAVVGSRIYVATDLGQVAAIGGKR
jgi:outer membrane protein assembly factor BamB